MALLLCTAGLVALDQRPAAACSCRPPSPGDTTAAAATADLVFVGRLIEFGPREGPADAPTVSGSILVTTAVKGVAVGDRVAVSISVRNESFCGTDVLRFAVPTGFIAQRDPTGTPLLLGLCSGWPPQEVAALATPAPTVAPPATPRARPVTVTPSLTG